MHSKEKKIYPTMPMQPAYEQKENCHNPYEYSTEAQDKNISVELLNDEKQSIVKPLLETCLRFGRQILDLMDHNDVDNLIGNKSCSMILN